MDEDLEEYFRNTYKEKLPV